MGGTEIKTLGVQNESDHNREPLVRRNYTEQDIPEVRWTAPSFLDLPAEIRNSVYTLLCAPISKTSPPSRLAQQADYRVEICVEGPIFFSPLSKLCRQIRKEYLSLLLSKHDIHFVNYEAARKWLDILGEEAARAPRELSLECDLSTSRDKNLTIQITDTQSNTPANTRKMQLWAVYDCVGYRRPSMHFNLICGHAATLGQSSSDAIHHLILREPCNNDRFTLGYFLSLVEQISKMDLQVCAIDAPAWLWSQGISRQPSFHVFPPSDVILPGHPKEDKVQILVPEGFGFDFAKL